MTFSDPEVVKLLNRSFVCAWMNKTPTARFDDGLCAKRSCPIGLRNGAGVTNVTAIFATADGTVLHAMPGYLDPPAFKRHLDFALKLNRVLTLPEMSRIQWEEYYKEVHFRQSGRPAMELEKNAHLLLSSRFMRIEEFPIGFFDGLGRGR